MAVQPNDPKTSSIGDRLWIDTNGNGVQDGGEAGLAGVTIQLLNTAGVVLATTTSAADGSYLFTGLAADVYQLQFGKKDGYGFTSKDLGGNDANDSDANITTGRSGYVALGINEQNRTVDAGYVPLDPKTSSIGDRVWVDTNGDGVQNDGATGVPGVTVILKNTAGTTLATTTTSADGSYLFDKLAAGQYQVQFSNTPGYSFTGQDQGTDDANDSDANTTTGLSQVVTLGIAQTVRTVDAGVVPLDPKTSSIGDRVWVDTNGDGIQNDGATGVSGVTVILKNTAGTLLATTTTGADGSYLFDKLAAGQYQVQFGNTPGYSFTGQDQGTDDANDSDANNTTGLSQVVSLGINQQNRTVDAGVVPLDPKTSSIGDRVWIDTNGDGIQNDGATGVPNVTVNLLDSTGKVLATQQTGTDGSYLFDKLAAGQYQVQFGSTPGYSFTGQDQGTDDANDSDANNTTGLSQLVSLGIAQQNRTVDAGVVPLDPKTSSIGDRVWVDTNGDGIQNDGATGVPGVTVNLLDSTGKVLATQQTGTDGSYLFDKLAAGQYQVQFGSTPGYTFTGQDKGTDDANDSDANTSTGLSQLVSLGIAQQNRTVDAGVVPLDPKTSSIGDYVWLDTNKDGIQNDGATGVAGVVVTLKDGSGNAIASTITGPDGSYLFDHLAAGQYQVQFGNKPGYSFTGQDLGGNDATDSDANATTGLSQIVSLGINQQVRTVDAGVVALDPKTAQLGDYLFFDENHNGVQDATEHGFAGDWVHLITAGADGKFGTADDVVQATTVTDANGKYQFTGLAAGQYQVQFGTDGTYAATLRDVGDDALDSDIDTTGKTQVVTLGIGESNQTIDAGLYRVDPKTAELGDRVWYDANKNGVQDTGEAGVAGVQVYAYSPGDDGKWGTADDFVRGTTTDASGYYKFTGLSANAYNLSFSNLPAGYQFTGKDQGGNDATDSDTDTSGNTISYALAAGQSLLTIDAGIYKPDSNSAQLGDRVWYDNNKNGVQDAGEAGVAGMNVALRAAGADGAWGTADDLIQWKTTDASGNYLFTNLKADNYFVWFGQNVPAGYSFTGKDLGGDDATDSDANQTTGDSGMYALADGQKLLTVDAGIYKPTAMLGDRVWLDTNKNGVQDAGETGIAGVKVDLRGAGKDNILNTADDYVASFTTNGEATASNYLFTGLEAGQYQVHVAAPTGYGFTGQGLGGNGSADSDVNASTGYTGIVNLAAGQQNLTIDAGVYLLPPPPPPATAALGDRVWIDLNQNGLQDAADFNIGRVDVKLDGAGRDGIWGNADDVHKTTYTSMAAGTVGNYLFDNLEAGQYKVSFKDYVSIVSGNTSYGTSLTSTKMNIGTNDAIDNDIVGHPGTSTDHWYETAIINLAAGERNMTIDAGFVANAGVGNGGTGSIGDYVWYDGNDNRAAGPGFGITYDNIQGTNSVERPIAGAVVWISGADGFRTATHTDASGHYLFSGLKAGDYKITFGVEPSMITSVPTWSFDRGMFAVQSFVGGADRDSNGSGATVHLNEGQHRRDIDYGVYGICPIALDLDGDGVKSVNIADTHGTFDLKGDGSQIESGWLSKGDGFLAVDHNGNGKIDSVHELFGGDVGDGFAKLTTYDTNHDGLVDAKDAGFNTLLVWQDLNGDHASSANEMRTLGEAGIASLKTEYDPLTAMTMQNGNLLGETSTGTRTDGSSIDVVDVYFTTGSTVASRAQAAAEPATIANKLAHLLQPADDLLHNALGQGNVSEVAAGAAGANIDGGETLRQMLANWSAHHTAV